MEALLALAAAAAAVVLALALALIVKVPQLKMPATAATVIKNRHLLSVETSGFFAWLAFVSDFCCSFVYCSLHFFLSPKISNSGGKNAKLIFIAGKKKKRHPKGKKYEKERNK